MPIPLPVLPGVYYSYVLGSFEGLPTGNIFSWEVPGVALGSLDDAANAGDISDALAINYAIFAADVMDTTYSGGSVKTYPLGSPLIPAQLGSFVATGRSAEILMSAVHCAVIRHNVVRRGRGSQSSTRVGPISRGDVLSDGITMYGPSRTAMDNAWNTMIASMEAITVTSGASPVFGQLSKKVGAEAFYLITGSETDVKVATQRRRARR